MMCCTYCLDRPVAPSYILDSYRPPKQHLNVSKLPGELLRYRAEVLPLHKTRAVAKFQFLGEFGPPIGHRPGTQSEPPPELRIPSFTHRC